MQLTYHPMAGLKIKIVGLMEGWTNRGMDEGTKTEEGMNISGMKSRLSRAARWLKINREWQPRYIFVGFQVNVVLLNIPFIKQMYYSFHKKQKM